MNRFMEEAIRLAEKGRGFVSPNPLVGAVIVKNNRIISRGYHGKYGKRHAEVKAIVNAGRMKLKGSDLYVTLEPCTHHGKQPPCTKAIILLVQKTSCKEGCYRDLMLMTKGSALCQIILMIC